MAERREIRIALDGYHAEIAEVTGSVTAQQCLAAALFLQNRFKTITDGRLFPKLMMTGNFALVAEDGKVRMLWTIDSLPLAYQLSPDILRALLVDMVGKMTRSVQADAAAYEAVQRADRDAGKA